MSAGGGDKGCEDMIENGEIIQLEDDQSEKDEKSEKGEKSFHTFISFEGCGHVIFATDDVFTSNADVGVDAWIWDKLYAA